MENHLNNVPVELVEQWQQFQSRYKTKSLNIQGITWHYIDAGHSEIPLVLLPGSVRFAEFWFRLIQVESARRRVVAVSLPPVEKLELLCIELVRLLDRLGMSQIDLLGTSLGGYLAQVFVRSHPQRVRRLILANTNSPRRTVSGKYQRLVWLVRWLPVRWQQLLLSAQTARLIATSSRDESFWRGLGLHLYDTYALEAGREDLLAPYRAGLDFGSYRSYTPRDLADWPGRIMIVETEDDPVLNQAARQALQTLYPQAEVRCLVRAGHYPCYTQPYEFSTILASFLDQPTLYQSRGA